jgi:DNA polymerase III subunit delta'
VDLTELPKVSSPLPWHGQEWTRLHRQLAAEQLPHALLLVGGQYTGKSQFALALSRLLLCTQTDDLYNCGRCHACELSASGGHGDFRWVQPMDNSRVIKVDQIREVVRFTNKTAGFGLRKVIVIAPIESMNINAFNAILKSLEEPAKDTYLILVCHRLYSVPATIRSRCQILRFARPRNEASADWLDTTTGNRDQSQHMLDLADGLPVLAHQLYSQRGYEEFAVRRVRLQALLGGDLTVSQTSALWSEVDTDIFLSLLSVELQRLVGSFSLKQLRTRHGKGLFRLLDDLAGLQQAVGVGANPNKQLIIDALMSKLRKLLGNDSHGDNIQTQSEGVRI